MSEIEDLVLKVARAVTTYTDVQWAHLRPAQRTHWLSLSRDTLCAAGVPELLAEIAEWHAECDKVGIPYDPPGLVRHHRANAGMASENWKAVATERGNKLDAANAALARVQALHHPALLRGDKYYCDGCSTDGEHVSINDCATLAAIREPEPTVPVTEEVRWLQYDLVYARSAGESYRRQRDTSNAALARFDEFADRMERESPKPGVGGFLAEIIRDIINPNKWND